MKMNSHPLRKLKRVRRSFGTTQKMIAEFLNITPQFYSQIELGKNTLSYELAIQISAYFGTTPDELFANDFGYERRGGTRTGAGSRMKKIKRSRDAVMTENHQQDDFV